MAKKPTKTDEKPKQTAKAKAKNLAAAKVSQLTAAGFPALQIEALMAVFKT